MAPSTALRQTCIAECPGCIIDLICRPGARKTFIDKLLTANASCISFHVRTSTPTNSGTTFLHWECHWEVWIYCGYTWWCGYSKASACKLYCLWWHWTTRCKKWAGYGFNGWLSFVQQLFDTGWFGWWDVWRRYMPCFQKGNGGAKVDLDFLMGSTMVILASPRLSGKLVQCSPNPVFGKSFPMMILWSGPQLHPILNILVLMVWNWNYDHPPHCPPSKVKRTEKVYPPSRFLCLAGDDDSDTDWEKAWE